MPVVGILHVCSAACPTVTLHRQTSAAACPSLCNACAGAMLTGLQVRRHTQPWRHCGGGPRVCKVRAAPPVHSPKLPRQCCASHGTVFTSPDLSSLPIHTWQLAHNDVPYLPPMPTLLHADASCHAAPGTAVPAAGNSAGVRAHQQLPAIPVSVLRHFHCSNVSHTCLPSCSTHLQAFLNPACNLVICTPSPCYAPCITPASLVAHTPASLPPH